MAGPGRAGAKRGKTALTEELNRALSSGLSGGVRMAISRTVVESQRWTSADICEASTVYESTQDVVGAGDILALRRGERVELLDDTDRSNFVRRRRRICHTCGKAPPFARALRPDLLRMKNSSLKIASQEELKPSPDLRSGLMESPNGIT